MARPRLAEGESVPLSTRLSPELDLALRTFMDETGLKRSDAAREVIARGLLAEQTNPVTPRRHRERAATSKDCPHPITLVIGGHCGKCGEPVKGTKR